MKIIKVCLRFVAALVVPFIVTLLIIRLGDSRLYPDALIQLDDGRNLIAVLGSGFLGGFCFTSLAYSIAPFFKTVFAVAEVVIMFVWVPASIVIMKGRGMQFASDWIPWTRIALCGVGMLFPILKMLLEKLKGKSSDSESTCFNDGGRANDEG